MHLHGHGGDAAEGGDALALDELEGPFGVPVVHHDELVARRGVGHQDRVASGGVEERHRQQVGARAPPLGVARARRPARASACPPGCSGRTGSSGWCPCCGGCPPRPWASPSCPTCRRWWRRPRASMRRRRAGSTSAGGRRPRARRRTTTGTGRRRGGAGTWVRSSWVTTTARRSGSSARWGRRRSRRAASTKATAVPESASPYWSSAPVHQALSGTTTPPAAAAPQKAMAHSGRLRMAMATRSPRLHAEAVPQGPGDGGRDAEVLLEGGALVLVDEVVLCRRGRATARGRRAGWPGSSSTPGSARPGCRPPPSRTSARGR